jgi:predicted DNA-binding transcriptional regulator AlpA
MVIQKPQLLTHDKAADFLGVTPGTLYVWRCTKRYEIPYIKIGGRVAYDAADLLTWLQSRRVG